jgi:integrase
MSVLSRISRRRTVATAAPSMPRLRVLSTDSQEQQNLQSPTFSDFLLEFRQDFSGWSPVTWRGLSGVLNNLEGEFGEIRLSSITPRAIDRYLSRRRREDGITTATCNRYLAALKTLFKQARIWSYIEELPTDALQMQKEASKVPDALSDDELERLLQHCPEPTYTIVAFAADTGMRKSEIGRLCWGDLDFGVGIITVRKTKNGRFRAIPMTSRVRELLPRTMPDDSTPDTSVFVRADIGPMLKKAALAAGIPHVHMHRLRHTFATRLRDRVVPLDRVMELLGHSSYQMVLRYAKARPQQLIEAIAALNPVQDNTT